MCDDDMNGNVVATHGFAPEPAQPLRSFSAFASTTILLACSTLDTSAIIDPGAPEYWMRIEQKGKGNGSSASAGPSE